MLEPVPGSAAKTVFEDLRRRHMETPEEGQLRAPPQRVKERRARQRPGKAVHSETGREPRALCRSDCTPSRQPGVTVDGEPHGHPCCHFAPRHSSWECAMLARSQTVETLDRGLPGEPVAGGATPRATAYADPPSARTNIQPTEGTGLLPLRWGVRARLRAPPAVAVPGRLRARRRALLAWETQPALSPSQRPHRALRIGLVAPSPSDLRYVIDSTNRGEPRRLC